MPRVSREQTDRNRLAIEQASARLFREKGFNGVSVADLMGAAGLTHGGFYGHFSSKDELAAVACANAFAQAAGRWEARMKNQPDAHSALHAILDPYLSTRMARNMGNGCPAATLSVDVARESHDKPVRAAYQAGTAQLVEILAALSPADGPAERRKQALVQWSTMVGVMMLASATDGDPIADELLAAVREHMLGDAARVHRRSHPKLRAP